MKKFLASVLLISILSSCIVVKPRYKRHRHHHRRVLIID